MVTCPSKELRLHNVQPPRPHRRLSTGQPPSGHELVALPGLTRDTGRGRL